MKASVYTSLFNYSPEKFDLSGAFKNWSKYADEVVIATFEEQRDEIIYHALCNSPREDFKFKVVFCPDTSLDDHLFDGKLKNAALQACSNELVIQLDADELIGGDIKQWEYLGDVLTKQIAPFSCMIPVIDLYKDYSHYKSVGTKWYLSLKKGLYRGPVNFAKKGGNLIDINKSDSCEAIDEHGDLVPSFADTRFIESFDTSYVHVIHTGYLDLDKRIENNKFWKPYWESRCGESVEVATTLEKLEEENKAIPHGLPEKWWTN